MIAPSIWLSIALLKADLSCCSKRLKMLSVWEVKWRFWHLSKKRCITVKSESEAPYTTRPYVRMGGTRVLNKWLCCSTCVKTKLSGVLIQTKAIINYQWAISRNYTRQIYKHIHVLHETCSTCLLLLLISQILNRTRQQNTVLVDCLFSLDDFDCSVIYTWGTDQSKAVIGGVTVIDVRAGGGARGAGPPKFWATQFFGAARDNLGKASF